MKKEDFLKQVKDEFEKVKTDEHYNQQQKNVKYASLMSMLEKFFSIPALADERFEALDEDVKKLYLELSNARIFEMTLQDYTDEFEETVNYQKKEYPDDFKKYWIYFTWSKKNDVMPNQDIFYQKMLSIEDVQLKELLLDTHRKVTDLIFSGEAEEFLSKMEGLA